MLTQHQKLKSIAKIVVPKGKAYTEKKLKTLKTIRTTVGSTLGPGGCPSVIERYEDLPPIVTKDGVTVFKALGFYDSVEQTILDLVRDSSQQTAREAGDGTTTAAILTEAFVRLIHEFCQENPGVAPQAVGRELQHQYTSYILPLLKSWAIKPSDVDFNDPENAGCKMLRGVANISSNGDTEMTEAIIQCFQVVGDYGNVTITEESGPSGYKVESIKGYPVHFPLDEIGRFWSKFINDQGTQSCILDKPYYILFNGKLNSIEQLRGVLEPMAVALRDHSNPNPDEVDQNHVFRSFNVVVVANGFSDRLIATFAGNFPFADTLNIFPVIVPKIGIAKGQEEILLDVAAITGAKLFDLSNPIEGIRVEDMGTSDTFECNRRMTNILGNGGTTKVEDDIAERIYHLEKQAETAISELEKSWFEERIAKISSGIAKLVVFGSSNGEIKEKKDRAEDAICAIRGALKTGVLPGGCWALNRAYDVLSSSKKLGKDQVFMKIMGEALQDPFRTLLENVGMGEEERQAVWDGLVEAKWKYTYDAMSHQLVNPFETSLYDSYQAVESALKNSLSVAIALGTSGSLICYGRDHELERARAEKLYESHRENEEEIAGWQAERFEDGE